MVAGWPPHETADSFVGGGLCSWVEYQQAFLAYRPVSGTSRQCGAVVTGAGVGVTHYWVVDQQAGTGGGSLLGGSCGCGWLVGFPRRCRHVLFVVRGGGVGGLLFVNYIVDASIFVRRAPGLP